MHNVTVMQKSTEVRRRVHLLLSKYFYAEFSALYEGLFDCPEHMHVENNRHYITFQIFQVLK